MKFHNIIITIIFLFLTACSNKNHQNRFAGEFVNDESVDFLVNEVVKSIDD